MTIGNLKLAVININAKTIPKISFNTNSTLNFCLGNTYLIILNNLFTKDPTM